MRLIGYIRVSRVNGREGESFISPDLQRESIESYAKLHRHEIVDWPPDLDQPGSRLDRQHFQSALAALSRGEADGLIAAKLDRLTRSVAHLGKLLELAKGEGWNLIAVDLGLDFRTSNGKLVANVLGSVAEWELDRRRENWADAQAHAVERGWHVASRAPTGYKRRDVKEKTGKPTGPLVLDPRAARVVHEVFRRRAAGAGWSALADFMTESGIPTPYGNTTWIPSAVAKLVQNRVYLGEARSGKHVKERAHDPIVTRAEWEAAQSARIGPSARNGEGLLLSGLVRCGSCRYRMKPDTMRDRDGSRLGNYRCRGRHAAGQCEGPASALARVLDPVVERKFFEAIGSGPVAEAAAVVDSDVADVIRELEEAEGELASYLETAVVSVVGREAFERGVRSRQARVDEIRRDLAKAQSATSISSALPSTPASLVEAWPDLSVSERRDLIAAVVDAVIVFPSGRQNVPIEDRIRILWRGEAPDDLPERGRRVELRPFERDDPCVLEPALAGAR